MFDTYDMNRNGHLDLNEFKCCVKNRSKIEQWTLSMPISDLVASALMPIVLRGEPCEDQLNKLIKTTDDELKTVCQGLYHGFYFLLRNRLNILSKAYKTQAEKSYADGSENTQSKFAFSMQCGSISDFYQGLGGRIGNKLQSSFHEKEFIKNFTTFSNVMTANRTAKPKFLTGYEARALQPNRIYNSKLQHQNFTESRMGISL